MTQAKKNKVYELLPPLDGSNRFKWEKRFWWACTVLVVVLDVALPKLWAVISIVYIAGVSNYALVLTAAGAQQAALAKEAAETEGPA